MSGVKIIHLHSSVNLFSSVAAFRSLYLFLLCKVTRSGNLEMFRCDVTSHEFPIHFSDGKLKRNGIQGQLFGDFVYSLLLIEMGLVIATSLALESGLTNVSNRQAQIVEGCTKMQSCCVLVAYMSFGFLVKHKTPTTRSHFIVHS